MEFTVGSVDEEFLFDDPGRGRGQKESDGGPDVNLMGSELGKELAWRGGEQHWTRGMVEGVTDHLEGERDGK